MTFQVHESERLSIEQMREFLEGSRQMEFALEGKAAVYEFPDFRLICGLENALTAPSVIAGGPQQFDMLPPGFSWHEPFAWAIGIRKATRKGSLVLTSVSAGPDPPLPGGAVAHELFFHLVSSAVVIGRIDIAVPYPKGARAAQLRLFTWAGKRWRDITKGVDPKSRRVLGTLPAPGTVVLATVR